MTSGIPCCLQCPYKHDDLCLIYATPAESNLVCALFRKWHHREGDDVPGAFPVLARLEPGVVYRIDNDLDGDPTPRPAYRVTPVPESA